MGTESGQWITSTNLWSEEGKALSKPLRARTYYYAGVQEFFSGKFQGSWEKLAEAEKIYSEIDNMVMVARSLCFKGLTGITIGRMESLDIFYKAIEIGSKVGDHYSVIIANTFLSETMMMLGKIDEATVLIKKAEELSRQNGDPLLIAAMLITKGNLGIVMNDRDYSISSYKECIDLHKYFSQMTIEGWGRFGLAYWSLIDHKAEEVKENIGSIFDLARKAGDLALQIGGLYSIAGYLVLTGHPEGSARMLGYAERMCLETGYNLWSSTERMKAWINLILKQKLTEEEFLKEFEAGKKLSLEKVMEEYHSLI
jgi:tetratricopeptide (TPR) repeat protein